MPTRKQRKIDRLNCRTSERHRRFVQAYLDVSNPKTFLKAKPSAISAGYSASYAHGRSYQLLEKVGIKREMKRVKNARLKSSTVASPEEVLETLTQQIRTLVTDLTNKTTGDFILPKDLTRDQAQAIAGFKIKRRIIPNGDKVPIIEDTIEYKLIDKLKALEMLGKFYGLFKPKDQEPLDDGRPQILVGYPTDPMPLAEWERQVRELMGNDKPAALTAPE